jgi:glutamine amidotransferase
MLENFAICWKPLELTDVTKAQTEYLNEAYFVHNYFASGLDPSNIISTYTWMGHAIPAHVGKGRVHGVQFHPEKSRISGVRFLQKLISQLAE